MSTLASVLMMLQGLIFIAWAFMMFRTLFKHRRRAQQRTGAMFPGLGEALRQWRHWWSNPEDAFERRLLIGLTLALFASIAALASANSA